jgi:membrane associated rhomboid family serine protease
MQPEISFQMPRPGKALIGVMVAVVAIWVLFAMGLNWGGVSDALLQPFVGNTSAVLHGQIWRLFTAPLIHAPRDPGHVLVTLLGLYFLGPTLEDRWGTKKTLRFLFGSAVFAFALQVIVGAVIPRLGQDIWFGGLGMVEAVAVAWALNNRHATVRLFFVLPVSGTMLLVFIFAMSVFNVIAQRSPAEGLITPFGGMLAGYLFGDASPLRRAWLKLRLKRLQAETAALSAASARRRRAGPALRVIKGGSDSDRPPKDKRYLN